MAKKLTKFGGVLGICMSVLAYLTATKKIPYFALPFAIGSFILGGVFCTVFVPALQLLKYVGWWPSSVDFLPDVLFGADPGTAKFRGHLRR